MLIDALSTAFSSSLWLPRTWDSTEPTLYCMWQWSVKQFARLIPNKHTCTQAYTHFAFLLCRSNTIIDRIARCQLGQGSKCHNIFSYSILSPYYREREEGLLSGTVLNILISALTMAAEAELKISTLKRIRIFLCITTGH